MRMTLDEARAECERWFAYMKAQEDKALALQELASDRRRGLCSDAEKDLRLAKINGIGVRVYDGGNLADAVRALLRAVDKA